MKSPKVSIVIPVYNGANYLKEAIDSALAQTYDNKEVMVVNDGSTDSGESEKIAKSYGKKIRYFKKKNGGVSSALNYGIKRMRGDWFSWLSHDDIYYKTKLTNQFRYIKKNPKAKFIYSNTVNIDENGNVISSDIDKVWNFNRSKTPPIQVLLMGNRFSGCSTLIHKNCFDKLGLFNEENLYSQDYEMWMMLSAYYRPIYCKTLAVMRRIHSEMGSEINKNEMEDYRKIAVINVLSKIPIDLVLPKNQCKFISCINLGDLIIKRWGLKTVALRLYKMANPINLKSRIKLFSRTLFKSNPIYFYIKVQLIFDNIIYKFISTIK